VEVYLAVAYGAVWLGASLYLVYLLQRGRTLTAEIRELRACASQGDVGQEVG
jgi:CcmD family protein